MNVMLFKSWISNLECNNYKVLKLMTEIQKSPVKRRIVDLSNLS